MWPFYSPNGWCRFYNSLGGCVELALCSTAYVELLCGLLTAPMAGADFMIALVTRWLRGACFMHYLLEAIVERRKILKLKGGVANFEVDLRI